MDSSLVFSLKLKLHHHSLPLQTLFSRRLPLTSSNFHLAAVKKPHKKVYCEFEPKLNGALSPNPESCFLDRQPSKMDSTSSCCYSAAGLPSSRAGIGALRRILAETAIAATNWFVEWQDDD
ncbi:hypothetical protein J1N35_001336 [Gossypium stocksii]|uniref:Uncharacterized protein n=1 Tax=Gossypium stocksii TaxID=47602 RepID=A0A9D3WK83_9ROSI|nr:hypothetical protein J1N35_001336 [Gossypium stocksii]